MERKQGAGMGVQLQYEEQVEKYGEDNARYLMEFFNQWTNHYQRGALIQFNFTRHLNLKEQVLDICDKHGWSFEELEGDLGLLEQWVNGAWDEDNFLIVHPGKHVIATYNDGIMGIKD